MNPYDRVTGLFWLLLSAFICIESLHLGVGTLQTPGMGFMAFCLSVLLGILSLALFLKTIFKKEKGEFSSTFSGTLWKRVIIVVIALIIYAIFMPKVGYLISTFLLMSFLFWVVKGTKWWATLFFSLLATIITYYCFSVWLRLEFPEGLFRL